MVDIYNEDELSQLPQIDKTEKIKEQIQNILGKRYNASDDFGIVTMCCGSGRTPGSQHWPIKKFDEVFRYKDTIVSYDKEKNNLEFITFGPGRGKSAKTPLDAAIGANPSIEEIISQQKELYQALNAIRKEMHQKNKVINITPDATIIGFSRGAAAIQKMSKELVKPLPVFVKSDDDIEFIGPHIEINKINNSYSIYNSDELVRSGTFSKKDLEDYKIDYETRVDLEKNINRFLWSNNVEGYENNILINPDNTAWISLDAVAGRADSKQLNDHYFNNEYCHGLYVMSTRLATEHAILGFGATNPDGDGMKKLSINGKHGAVFDDESLRKTIVDNINTKDKLEERLKKIGDAVEQENKNLLLKSVLGTEVGMNMDSNDFPVQLKFKEQIKAKPEETLGKLNEKINEKNSLWTKVGRLLGIGSGEQRTNQRHKNFGMIEEEIKQFINEENKHRKDNHLPSLEGYAKAYNNINDKLKKVDFFIKNTNNEKEKVIALNLLDHLWALKIQTNIDSTKSDLKKNLEQASLLINEANSKLPEANSKLPLPSFWASSELKGILGKLDREIRENIKELENFEYIGLEEDHSKQQVCIFKKGLISMKNESEPQSEKNPDQGMSF